MFSEKIQAIKRLAMRTIVNTNYSEVAKIQKANEVVKSFLLTFTIAQGLRTNEDTKS